MPPVKLLVGVQIVVCAFLIPIAAFVGFLEKAQSREEIVAFFQVNSARDFCLVGSLQGTVATQSGVETQNLETPLY
jgi:hypothetical protein